MNPLVRRFLRTAVLFLAVGLALGFWMLLVREFGVRAPARILSAHTHAILVGFVMLMITGVALWMFPRPRANDVVFRPGLAALAYWGIAGGTAARISLELVLPPNAGWAPRVALVVAGGVQALGLLLFFATMWTRIRSSGAGSTPSGS